MNQLRERPGREATKPNSEQGRMLNESWRKGLAYGVGIDC